MGKLIKTNYWNNPPPEQNPKLEQTVKYIESVKILAELSKKFEKRLFFQGYPRSLDSFTTLNETCQKIISRANELENALFIFIKTSNYRKLHDCNDIGKNWFGRSKKLNPIGKNTQNLIMRAANSKFLRSDNINPKISNDAELFIDQQQLVWGFRDLGLNINETSHTITKKGNYYNFTMRFGEEDLILETGEQVTFVEGLKTQITKEEFQNRKITGTLIYPLSSAIFYDYGRIFFDRLMYSDVGIFRTELLNELENLKDKSVFNLFVKFQESNSNIFKVK